MLEGYDQEPTITTVPGPTWPGNQDPQGNADHQVALCTRISCLASLQLGSVVSLRSFGALGGGWSEITANSCPSLDTSTLEGRGWSGEGCRDEPDGAAVSKLESPGVLRDLEQGPALP